jgi:ADP-L-glycero-D-manno-heptose 6-epimerase
MKKIVITGAAGMIGSGVVRHLNDQGMTNLILVDELGTGDQWKNLVGKQFCELLSFRKLFAYLAGRHEEIEAILHLGACSDTTEVNADYLLENNYRFTIDLASYALSHHLRLIYASSAATYGDGSLGFSDDKELIPKLKPLNMYGYSKHLVDLWMQKNNVLHEVVGLKYFNVFGPNEYHKGPMASFVCKMAGASHLSLFRSNDTRFADGEQRRDFIYLKDAVAMTCAFLQNPSCGIFNIGFGASTTWNQMAQYLLDARGGKGSISYVEMPPQLHLQYQNDTCADMRKFHTLFSYKPTPIREAVFEYVNDYLVKQARW